MQRRLFLAALSSLPFATLAGCAVHAGGERTVRTVTPANTRVYQAPPAPLAETIPTAPDADAYWIPGHWAWGRQGYVWEGGHWVRARPGMVYQQAWWSQKDNAWTYHPGRWVSIDAPLTSEDPAPPPVVVYEAPPAPQVEVIPVAPSPVHVWISGYWGYRRGRWSWQPGYWSGPRVGYYWAPGHWHRRGSGWHFSGGYWRRR